MEFKIKQLKVKRRVPDQWFSNRCHLPE